MTPTRSSIGGWGRTCTSASARTPSRAPRGRASRRRGRGVDVLPFYLGPRPSGRRNSPGRPASRAQSGKRWTLSGRLGSEPSNLWMPSAEAGTSPPINDDSASLILQNSL
jgi:hypothetical protein